MLRHWPGNVRELLSEARASAQKALGASTRRLEPQHLDARAGVPLHKQPEPAASAAVPPPVPKPMSARSAERDKIEEALKQAGGNISAAARALGLHRTQLTRLMEKLDISAQRGLTPFQNDTDK